MTDWNRSVSQWVRCLCLFVVVTSGLAVAQTSETEDAWARVLNTYVDERGRVDFTSLQANPKDLQTYVDHIAAVSPRSSPGSFPGADAELSYYLNSYNALAMYNVIETGIPFSLAGIFRKFTFFYWKEFNIGGEKLSLYDYENKIIRPLGDPRVHFALNCMSVSCPRLPRVPFSADLLQSQLDAQAWQFFAESGNLRVDHARSIVEVSEILDFYTEDFLQTDTSLIAYINRYREDQIPDTYTVQFIDYDWTINRQ